MTAHTLTWGSVREDLDQSRKRVRWTMGISIGFHALLVLWIVIHRTQEMNLPVLTEITLVDPADLEPAAAPPAPAGAAALVSAGLPRSNEADAMFRREKVAADVQPDPQSDLAFSDKLNERLSALRHTDQAPVAGAGVAPVPSTVWGPPAAVASKTVGTGSSSISLHREGGEAPALTLSRGPGLGSTQGLSAASVRTGPAVEQAPATTEQASAKRTLAGASLAGPIADRAVLSYATPVYPEWAKRDAVEGSVTLYFTVRPDGSVKENVLVQKTAGFEDFDENARTALRAWRFEPLHGGRTGEQWGTITFRYRLRDSN